MASFKEASLYNDIMRLLHGSSKSVEQKNKEILYIIKHKTIDENCAININLYMCKYGIDTGNHVIKWDLLYPWLYKLKKYKFKSHDFCITTLNIVKLAYKALHYKYHSILFHFILISYNNRYGLIIDIIDLLLDFHAYIVPRRIRYFYINKLISYIAQAYGKKYINAKNIIYQDFCIMFPEYINKLNSLILLNKLEV